MKIQESDRARYARPLDDRERNTLSEAKSVVEKALAELPTFPLATQLNCAAAAVTEAMTRAADYQRAALSAQHKAADAVSRVKQLLASKDRIAAENDRAIKTAAHRAALKKLVAAKYNVTALSGDERAALEWTAE